VRRSTFGAAGPIITWAAFVLLYLPLGIMLIYSFIDPSEGAANPTLRWYHQALSDALTLSALKTSLWVGIWTTVVSGGIGTMAALALQRARFPGKRLLEALTYVPLVMPEIVMGLSLLLWFVALGLRLGTFSVILAHVTFSLSYVVITVKSRLADFDVALEEAAFDLGATPWQVFWKITFPLIWPGILSGALIAFTLSFDDFLVTFFTAGVGADTLPLRIYAMIRYGVSPEIHALSCLMVAGTIALVLLFFNPGRGDGVTK
jgi:spermidine/putrescine transport system permease protein